MNLGDKEGGVWGVCQFTEDSDIKSPTTSSAHTHTHILTDEQHMHAHPETHTNHQKLAITAAVEELHLKVKPLYRH